jgi:phosphopantothenoylcysteine decarboxylase/phosphopantothenate--cysteine ligase
LENEIENAKLKSRKKNLGFDKLNSLQDLGAGLVKKTNKTTLSIRTLNIEPMELKLPADMIF